MKSARAFAPILRPVCAPDLSVYACVCYHIPYLNAMRDFERVSVNRVRAYTSVRTCIGELNVEYNARNKCNKLGNELGRARNSSSSAQPRR